ncbi:MAG: sulfite exporter TauE/SafE family protein [Desulfomonilia bacterium]
MTVEAALLVLLTLVASTVGTTTGFGISTIMIPVMAVFVPLPVALMFVGIIHLFGDAWNMLLFKGGLRWRLILGFGIPGMAASYAGAALTVAAGDLEVKKILGLFLMAYVIFLFVNRTWALPGNNITAVAGGLLSGLFAGFFGVGGAVRSAFLTAFDLPKETYVFTSGIIAFFIDIVRIHRYWLSGVDLGGPLAAALVLCVPASLAGAFLGRRFLQGLPQRHFRLFVAGFLFLAGLRLLLS